MKGDLDEQFDAIHEKKTLFRAKLNYWYQVIHYLRPFAITKNSTQIINTAMFKHSLIISIRNFNRYRSSFVINIVGLSTGLACSLLIYLWISDELAMDKFHNNDSRLYQVLERNKGNEGWGTSNQTRGPMAKFIKEGLPEVEYSTAVGPASWPGFNSFTVSDEQRSVRATGQYAGKDFFNIFSFNLLSGDKNQVLSDKNSIVISEELSKKIFKTTDAAIGKVVQINRGQEFIVSGIMENIPDQSSMQFDMVMPYETLEDIKPWVKSWGNSGPIVYVSLIAGTDVDFVNEKIAGLLKERFGVESASKRTAFLKQFSSIYLFGVSDKEAQRIRYVRLFSIIAVFILLIACINFMNLSTARASRRLKEVGIKKVVGAKRKSLILQFLGESVLISFLSLATGLLIVLLFLPEFNRITGKQLSIQLDQELLLPVLVVTFITGIIAGSYPALYLSGFKPIRILKSGLSSSTGEVWIRKSLVVFQYSISILMIVCVLVVYNQIEFVQNKYIGYEKENVIWFEMEGNLKENPDAFVTELRKLPGVQNAAGTSHRIVGHNWSTTGLQWEGRDPEDKTGFQIVGVDYGFIEMMKFDFMEGRSFSNEYGADIDKIIFNEVAIEAMNMSDPIGKSVNVLGGEKEIIGVAKNFHFKSLHEKLEPQLFLLMPSDLNKIMVKIGNGRETEALASIGKFYESYNPEFTFDYQFLDDNYQNLYLAEQRVSTLSKYFAGIAILISCLGLFGLAAFTAERRRKEIGIRKVLGSSVFEIVRLLSGGFIKMVLVAILIATPVAYFIAISWLDQFAYRIELEWWYFAGAGMLAIAVVWFTVGFQTIKASSINPTECLKEE